MPSPWAKRFTYPGYGNAMRSIRCRSSSDLHAASTQLGVEREHQPIPGASRTSEKLAMRYTRSLVSAFWGTILVAIVVWITAAPAAAQPVDADGDGHNSIASGGDDCDDNDP